MLTRRLRLNELAAHLGREVECDRDFEIEGVAGLESAGSTTVERGAVIMGQAGAAGHLPIGAGAVAGPQSGPHKDVGA